MRGPREAQIAKIKDESDETFRAELRLSRELRVVELYYLHDRARAKGDVKTQLAVLKLF